MTEPNSHQCTHCNLRFSGPVVTDGDDCEGPVFCCMGCRAVYHTLHNAGLDDFYAMRQSWSSDEAHPVDEETLAADELSVFDTPGFLDENGDDHGDNTVSVDLYLEGVHCAGCVWLVERMPRLVDGVADARLELSRGRMTLRFNPEKVALSEIAGWLGKFGFQAHPLQSDNVERRSSAGRKMLIRVGICWAVAANVMLMTIAIYAGLDGVLEPGLHNAALWTTFGLSAISLVAGGTVFFRRAWASLKTGRLSMDVPISLGILVGWGHSGWATISGTGEVWFDSIVVLIAALLTARYLQVRGNSLAADAAERLVSLLPRTARRIVDFTGENDEIETVAADRLEVGDRIEVRAGDVIAADGRIILGSTRISRAVLTGESRPEAVTDGDFVEAGTTNLASPIVVAVAATGAKTRVGRLMDWVEDRGQNRAPIVQLADRLGSVFIGVVLVAAVFTAVAWSIIDPSRAVANVVALLVIACPCALGMATPLALTVGVGQAARRGIHIKHDDVIEALEGVTDVVFDKTGTLTMGRPSVVDATGDLDAAGAACALETHSNHPMATALLRWAKYRDGDPIHFTDHSVDAVTETPGAGLSGRVDGKSVAIGRISWFDDIDSEFGTWAQARADEGLTPVAIAVDDHVQAVLAIGDRLRDDSPDILDKLQRQDIRTHLLSGDHPQVVAAAGRSLGIDASYVRGGVTPEDKLEYIKTLCQDSERVVAMIGDGVNDAAALQAADIGIAVGGGAEASLVAADVFLVKDGIEPVAELLDGSNRIMGVVRRNLAGSGAYNFFGISLAAMGFITPLAAAILMPISSLAVVASSLVQRSFSTGTDAERNTGSIDDVPATLTADRAQQAAAEVA